MGEEREQAGGPEPEGVTRFAEFYPPGSRREREFRAVLSVMSTARLWTNAVERRLRERTGQTRARWETLFAIAFAGGPTTASEIAKRMGIQWPALVRMLDALETDRLIGRRGNPADGRSRLIELTAAGEQVVEEVRNTVDPARAEVLADMEDGELDQIITLVGRVRDRLKRGSATD